MIKYKYRQLKIESVIVTHPQPASVLQQMLYVVVCAAVVSIQNRGPTYGWLYRTDLYISKLIQLNGLAWNCVWMASNVRKERNSINIWVRDEPSFCLSCKCRVHPTTDVLTLANGFFKLYFIFLIYFFCKLKIYINSICQFKYRPFYADTPPGGDVDRPSALINISIECRSDRRQFYSFNVIKVNVLQTSTRQPKERLPFVHLRNSWFQWRNIASKE